MFPKLDELQFHVNIRICPGSAIVKLNFPSAGALFHTFGVLGGHQTRIGCISNSSEVAPILSSCAAGEGMGEWRSFAKLLHAYEISFKELKMGIFAL
jgi:hypothetical protein